MASRRKASFNRKHPRRADGTFKRNPASNPRRRKRRTTRRRRR